MKKNGKEGESIKMNNKGFTMIELLAVIVILALLIIIIGGVM